MFLVGIFQWWYGEGWLRHTKLSGLKILRVADFFSIDLLARTLFSPFHQISAGRVNGPLPVRLRAFTDRLFSRFFGAMVRTIFIVIGLLAILARSLWTMASVVGWSILPITPIIGAVLWQMGISIWI